METLDRDEPEEFQNKPLRVELLDPYFTARHIYNTILAAVDPDLDAAEALGMIRKEMLVHGGVYAGYSQPANVAHWDEAKGVFRIRVFRFSDSFFEETFHPQDIESLDVFCPTEKIAQLKM